MEEEKGEEEGHILRLCVEIANFDQLSEGEVLILIQDIMQDFENVDILSIRPRDELVVEVRFRFKKFHFEQYAQRYYQQQYDNANEIAEQIRFPNCRSMTEVIGKSRKIKKQDCFLEEECSICQTNYQEKELMRELPNCKHHFHKRCLDKWLKKKAQCPMCRKNLFEERVKEAILESAKEHGVEIEDSL